MTLELEGRAKKNRIKKISKRLLILLILIFSLLLETSFFVFVAAYDNSNEKEVSFWDDNCEEIREEYLSNTLTTNIAGTIQFNKRNIFPFYSSVENVNEGASLFGHVLPGQIGRSIILGHKEQGFACLAKVEIGDIITVDSYEGEFLYVVRSVEVVVPSDIPLDNTEESILTLVSQYPFWSVSADRRYVVEAVLSGCSD